MNDLVSVVITSYNYGAYVGGAIRSALDQTYRNVEVLVNENCSTDDSLDIINAIDDDRLRVIAHPENIGFLPNLNNGIKEARGKFVVILSADDLLLPTLIEDAMEQRRLHPEADVVYLSVAIMDERQRFREFFQHPALDGAESFWGRNEFATLLTRDNCMYLPTTLFPRTFFEEFGLLDETLGVLVDYEWDIRLAGAGKRFAFLSKPGALIRFHGDNLSGVKRFVGSGRQLREFCYILEKYSRPVHHHLVAGYRVELEAMVDRKIAEMRDLFPEEFAKQEPELMPLVEAARRSIATVPAIGEATQRGNGLISVVLPYHGRIACLQRALESLRDQNYRNWEVIVACDSCHDPSSIVDWMGLGGRVRVARLQGLHGASAARNLALGCINGEIVAYLDEDNQFEGAYLKTLAGVFADPSVNAAASASRLAVAGTLGAGETLLETDLGLLPDGCVSLVSNRLPLNAVAHRRLCLALVGTFHVGLDVLEDWEFLIRLNRRYPLARLGRVACTLGIDVTLAGHHVFGRRSSLQWSQYAQRLQDVYNAYPPRSESERAARGSYAGRLQSIVQNGVHAQGNVAGVAEFVLALAGPSAIDQVAAG